MLAVLIISVYYKVKLTKEDWYTIAEFVVTTQLNSVFAPLNCIKQTKWSGAMTSSDIFLHARLIRNTQFNDDICDKYTDRFRKSVITYLVWSTTSCLIPAVAYVAIHVFWARLRDAVSCKWLWRIDRLNISRSVRTGGCNIEVTSLCHEPRTSSESYDYYNKQHFVCYHLGDVVIDFYDLLIHYWMVEV